MRSIVRKSARPSRMLPRSTKVSPTRRRRWQPRFRPARNILRSRRAATTSRHWSSGCCLSKPPSGPEKSRRRPAFPIACRRQRPLGRSLFRHVAGLGLDRVVDAVVRWRAQLHDLDKSVTHSLVAIIAVFDDCGVRRIESLHVFCLYCFVDQGESFVVKFFQTLYSAGLVTLAGSSNRSCISTCMPQAPSCHPLPRSTCFGNDRRPRASVLQTSGERTSVRRSASECPLVPARSL